MNLKHPCSYHLPELTVVIDPTEKAKPTKVLKARKYGKHLKSPKSGEIRNN
jgi:hypothetical protein